ncbi:MAG: penicillin-binding protein 2 [Dehalococcoidia bacterium]|nr:penicillin-binding protein 2 [Dehalococcoidia bacterium]
MTGTGGGLQEGRTRPIWRPKKKQKNDQGAALKRRLILFRTVVVLAFVVLALQLWRMQVVEGRYYQGKAENNRIRVLALAPVRGVIYDRNGVPLVRNVPSFSVSIVPADVPRDMENTVARRLSRLIPVDPQEVVTKVEAGRTPQQYFLPIPVLSGVSKETALSIDEMHTELPGVTIQIEAVRNYLGGPSFSPLLGYTGRISAEEYSNLKDVGYQLQDKLGKAGVELSYQSVLRGKPGQEQVEVDVDGRKISSLNTEPPQPGSNLKLTIDSDLQRQMDVMVKETMGSSNYAAAVAMDPQTGQILGMVSEPTYDNNIFSGTVSQSQLNSLLNDPRRPLLNYATGIAQPPGSIFKLITASAALQEGIATASTRIYSAGSISVPSQYDPSIIYTFYDWAALGWLDLRRAIAQSSDVYFYYLSGGYQDFKGLGVEKLASYAKQFGLGAPTGVDLPGETSGLIPDPQWKQERKNEPWLLGDTYNMSIGQGDVLASPLQMVTMVSAVANGGEVLRPQIVDEVLDAEGKVLRPFTKDVVRKVTTTQSNLAVVREGMKQSAESGTGISVKAPGIEVGAKTGTAEFGALDPVTGQRPTHGWTLAFAPYDNPKIALVVYHEVGQGALTAAPLAGKILQYYFSHH